jgi:uncharacterized protein YegP (UPF0339 family)
MIFAVVFGSVLAGGAALALRSSSAPAAAADDKAAAKFEVYKDRAGEFRWRLRATNTQILATSGDSYKAKRDCLNAIDSVKRAAANAPVEEVAEGQAQGASEQKEGDTPAAKPVNLR